MDSGDYGVTRRDSDPVQPSVPETEELQKQVESSLDAAIGRLSAAKGGDAEASRTVRHLKMLKQEGEPVGMQSGERTAHVQKWASEAMTSLNEAIFQLGGDEPDAELVSRYESIKEKLEHMPTGKAVVQHHDANEPVEHGAKAQVAQSRREILDAQVRLRSGGFSLKGMIAEYRYNNALKKLDQWEKALEKGLALKEEQAATAAMKKARSSMETMNTVDVAEAQKFRAKASEARHKRTKHRAFGVIGSPQADPAPMLKPKKGEPLYEASRLLNSARKAIMTEQRAVINYMSKPGSNFTELQRMKVDEIYEHALEKFDTMRQMYLDERHQQKPKVQDWIVHRQLDLLRDVREGISAQKIEIPKDVLTDVAPRPRPGHIRPKG